MRLAALLFPILTAASMVAPALARADVFGPISLASEGALGQAGQLQQADYARDAAISGNGRYVAFDGSYGGVRGVWRRDLDEGTIEAVTVCVTPSDPHPAACDAELPSISADGRYVSFTTTAALDPSTDTNSAPDVYVRDMSRGESDAGAFTLASAVNGAAQGLTYEPPGKPPSPFEETSYGSVASGRSALSADGRRVAFVTTEISNLAGKGTPALQVAVRDLDTLRTELVSVTANPATGTPELDEAGLPKPVSAPEGEYVYGAVFSPGAVPPRFAASQPYAMAPRVGASISADGSTVAWMGQDVGLQTRTLPEETLLASYAEPLWRRIADGPSAPTLRVTGGSEAASAACLASGERRSALPPSLADPCQGPFRVEAPALGTFSEVAADSVPQLSADGSMVAFLANAPPLAQGGDFGASLSGLHSDVYVADMHEGLTRTQALHPLTELAGANEGDIATNATVIDLGISPDGTQVAFTTQRTVFPLGSPAYVSAPAGAPGMAELFDADLAEDTLTRVTHGFEGGAAEHPHRPVSAEVDPYENPGDGALSPSFSADGDTLAFSSTASNLVYGDGNTPPLGTAGGFDGADAFTVQRVRFGSQPTPQEISSPPASPPLAPAWRVGVTPLSRRDGSVLLYVQAPEAGRLAARAAGAVAVPIKHARHAREHVLLRTVSRSSATSGADGSARIALALAPRYRALASRPGGLTTTVTVAFAAAGHPPLRASVIATFVRSATHHASTRKAIRGKAGRARHRRAATR
jgi:WD40-like Beta Propeller Repeat